MGGTVSRWMGGEGSWLTATSVQPITWPRAQEELLHTEQTYYLSLATCADNVVAPLRRQEGKVPSLSVASQRRIFANLEDVVRLHRSFLRDLTLLMEQSDPRFEPLFRKYVGLFKDTYSQYIIGYQPELLQKKIDSSSALEDYIEAKRVDMKGKDLSAVLIMPIQRLPRYVLLLQTIKEKHAKTTEEQEDIQQCVDLMKQTTQYVNEEKKVASQMADLQQIENSLLHTEDHPPLVRRGRWVVDTRVVELKEKNKSVHCYLCNDLLILAVVNRLEQLGSVMKGHLSSLGSTFHPIEWTELDNIRVTRVDKTDNVLAIASRTAKWHLQFPSMESLQEWRNLLSENQAKLEESPSA